MRAIFSAVMALLLCTPFSAHALELPDMEFKVFQFPADMIPRIDGNTEDWDMVGEDYTYGNEYLYDNWKPPRPVDAKDHDAKVRVGWVKGFNRLYFLYEAYDDYWDFENAWGDIFEIAVDADLSGGPFIKNVHPDKTLNRDELHFTYHGVHAQNYHIFTPPGDTHWTMVWGGNPWISYLPYANAAYQYDFKQGESGKLVLEFWVTCFDYAPFDPARAIESKLVENNIIGLAWNIIEYEGHNKYESHWTLSPDSKMVYDGSYLCAFRLMPIEKQFRKPIECDWTFKVVDLDRRQVAFQDLSYGTITSWLWDFGDDTTSTEQNPIHVFDKPGEKTVTLVVEGPAGKARHIKVWDVAVK